MIDSINARRGAATNIKKKLTNTEFRCIKKEIKDKLLCKNATIATSDYFQYFDESNPKDMNGKQYHYLRIAAEVALASDMNHKHGAIIVHKKNIISVGYNHYSNTNYSIHAEVDAISRLKGREKDILNECELYVVRIGPNNLNTHLKYSKPCYNCQNYISKMCIKKTYYSTNYDYDQMIAKYIRNKTMEYEE